MNKVLGIINLHEDPVFEEIHENRILANTPLLGRYYFIDFALSNFSNSNINSIEILLKERPTLLFKHLNLGAKEWAVNTKTGGITIMFNEDATTDSDLENLLINKQFIESKDIDYIIICPSNIIANIDYKEIINNHIESQKNITMLYTTTDVSNHLDKFEIKDEKIIVSEDEDNTLAFLNIYVFNKKSFISLLNKCTKEITFDNFKSLLYSHIQKKQPNLFLFKNFISVVNTIEDYYKMNTSLLNQKNLNSLFNNERPIYTRSYNNIPTKYGKRADVSNSLIANEVSINGTVKNSILFRGVTVEEGAIVENSILYSRSTVKKNSVVKNAILEKNVVIEKQQIIGETNKPKYIK